MKGLRPRVLGSPSGGPIPTSSGSTSRPNPTFGTMMMSPNSSSTRPLLSSDLEDAAREEERHQNAAEQVLDKVGELLDQAEHALDDLDEEMLGSAILRGSQEIADAIKQLADQIDQQSDEERRALARACLEDAQQHSLLLQDGENPQDTTMMRQPSAELQEFSQMDENDLARMIHTAGSFLRDVEDSLRSVEEDDANELADVALTVARLFLASVQSFHAQLTPHDLTEAVTSGVQSRSLAADSRSSSFRIELIDDHEDEDDDDDEGVTPRRLDRSLGNATTTRAPTDPQASEKKKKVKKETMDRLRVLWPPLGPAVGKVLDSGKGMAAQQPILAVALGMTMWPAAVMAAFVGTPAVLIDGVVQDVYNNYQDGPIIENLERGAAQMYHTGRLALISGKLVSRQTLRVVQRQVDRHGGVGQIAGNVAGMAVHRVTHPIETIGMAWNGISWGVDRIREVVDHVTDQERESQVQDLQQLRENSRIAELWIRCWRRK